MQNKNPVSVRAGFLILLMSSSYSISEKYFTNRLHRNTVLPKLCIIPELSLLIF